LDKALDALLYTKFWDWKYEKEVRQFTRLETCIKEGEFFFERFSERMVLVEVIVGALCDIKLADILDACAGLPVKVTKARLAFRTFSVVTDRRGMSRK